MKDIQSIINSETVPSNLRFNYKNFLPQGNINTRGTLACRERYLKMYASELYEPAYTSLDIGCNVGYFSLSRKDLFDSIEGVDTRDDHIDLFNRIIKSKDIQNIKASHSGFREYYPITHNYFENIYLGHVYHYLWGNEGLGFIRKLAAISSGYVIIEGPLHKYDGALATSEINEFTRENILEQFKLYFDIVRIRESDTFGRSIIVLKRKQEQVIPSINIQMVPETQEHNIQQNVVNKETHPVTSKDGLVFKLMQFQCAYHIKIIDILSRVLDCVARPTHFIREDRDKIVGGVFEYVEGGVFPDRDNPDHINAVKDSYIKIQTVLKDMGIVWLDPGPPNFIIKDGKAIAVDIKMMIGTTHYHVFERSNGFLHKNMREIGFTNNDDITNMFDKYFTDRLRF